MTQAQTLLATLAGTTEQMVDKIEGFVVVSGWQQNLALHDEQAECCTFSLRRMHLFGSNQRIIEMTDNQHAIDNARASAQDVARDRIYGG